MKKILLIFFIIGTGLLSIHAQQLNTSKIHNDFSNYKSTNPGFHTEINYSSLYNFDADSLMYVIIQDTDSMMFYFNKEDGKYSYYRKYWDYQKQKWKFYEKVEHYLDSELSAPILTDYMFYFRAQVNDRHTAYIDYIGDSTCIIYEWDTLTSEWYKFYKLDRFISDEGIDTLSKGYIWDTLNKHWNFNTFTKIKTSNAQIDSIIISDQFVDSEGFTRFSIYVNNYDHNSRLTKITELNQYGEHRNTDSIIYGNNNKKKFVYSKSLDDTIYSVIEEYLYDNLGRIDSIPLWYIESDIQDKLFYGYLKFFYPEQTIISIEKTTGNSHYFFPNPAKESIQIHDYFGDIKIINLSGQVLIESKVQPGENIDITRLMPGCYIVQFENSKSELLIKK